MTAKLGVKLRPHLLEESAQSQTEGATVNELPDHSAWVMMT